MEVNKESFLSRLRRLRRVPSGPSCISPRRTTGRESCPVVVSGTQPTLPCERTEMEKLAELADRLAVEADSRTPSWRQKTSSGSRTLPRSYTNCSNFPEVTSERDCFHASRLDAVRTPNITASVDNLHKQPPGDVDSSWFSQQQQQQVQPCRPPVGLLCPKCNKLRPYQMASPYSALTVQTTPPWCSIPTSTGAAGFGGISEVQTTDTVQGPKLSTFRDPHLQSADLRQGAPLRATEQFTKRPSSDSPSNLPSLSLCTTAKVQAPSSVSKALFQNGRYLPAQNGVLLYNTSEGAVRNLDINNNSIDVADVCGNLTWPRKYSDEHLGHSLTEGPRNVAPGPRVVLFGDRSPICETKMDDSNYYRQPGVDGGWTNCDIPAFQFRCENRKGCVSKASLPTSKSAEALPLPPDSDGSSYDPLEWPDELKVEQRVAPSGDYYGQQHNTVTSQLPSSAACSDRRGAGRMSKDPLHDNTSTHSNRRGIDIAEVHAEGAAMPSVHCTGIPALLVITYPITNVASRLSNGHRRDVCVRRNEQTPYAHDVILKGQQAPSISNGKSQQNYDVRSRFPEDRSALPAGDVTTRASTDHSHSTAVYSPCNYGRSWYD